MLYIYIIIYIYVIYVNNCKYRERGSERERENRFYKFIVLQNITDYRFHLCDMTIFKCGRMQGSALKDERRWMRDMPRSVGMSSSSRSQHDWRWKGGFFGWQ